ncbi:MAG: hypothetical protein ACR5K2_04135 [Wolbachia sp.]
MNSTLNIESFKFYIQQDVLFLDNYVRTILIMISRIEDHNNIVLLAKVAQELIAANKFLHDCYFTVYGIRRKNLLYVSTLSIFFHSSRIVVSMKP